MKKILFILSLSITIVNCSDSKEQSFIDDNKHFQYDLNKQYANPEESPLTKEDIKTFKKLDFFEIDKKYKIEASLELTPNSPIFEFQTTTDRKPLYKKYGIAHFSLDGKKCSLSLYQSQNFTKSTEHSYSLFLPYNDTTNGDLTYGGGRFIDLDIPADGSKTIVIDFNKSYNPYCAYNHKYSCPIPPSENSLDVAILAGEKAYKEHH